MKIDELRRQYERTIHSPNDYKWQKDDKDNLLARVVHRAMPALLDLAEAAQRCADEPSIAGAGDKWRDVLAALESLRAR